MFRSKKHQVMPWVLVGMAYSLAFLKGLYLGRYLERKEHEKRADTI